MNEGKCQYCFKEIHPNKSRCETCGRAWLEGHNAGKDEMSRLFRKTINTFYDICNLEQPLTKER